LTCADTTGIERKFPCDTIPLGQLSGPSREFTTVTNPQNFFGVTDPAGTFGRAVQNVNLSSQGEPHSTWGTGRDVPLGSTSCVAFTWLYQAPSDLVQTGRNLVNQLEMVGSPIYAVSTLNGNWTLVDRINGVQNRATLGPIPWGHWTYWVVCTKLADSDGYIRAWWARDAWPSVGATPAFDKTGDTYQGDSGHHTLGQYSAHSSPGTYTGYFSAFGRAATPQRAIELAR